MMHTFNTKAHIHMNDHSINMNSTVPEYYITPYTQLAVFTCLTFQPSLLFLSSSHGVCIEALVLRLLTVPTFLVDELMIII